LIQGTTDFLINDMMTIGKNNFSISGSNDRSLVRKANSASDKIVIRIGSENIHGIPFEGNQAIQFNYAGIFFFHAIFFNVVYDPILDALMATKKRQQNRNNTQLFHCKAVFNVRAGKRVLISRSPPDPN
jgi:hypothetical protein